MDYVYISPSESILGNIKDILIYFTLLGKLDRIYIHMLGGTGMDKILNRTKILSMINGFFMKRMKGVIVEGQRGTSIFQKYFTNEKIKIIPNFADDYLHSTEAEIDAKFNEKNMLQILYLSNMLREKGYTDLLEAYIALPSELRQKSTLKFVGGFPNQKEKQIFLDRISRYTTINYLGEFIDGDDKRKLYMDSHIFCLPTYYPYEGQPISILEAYSTGCVVLTTQHAGIPDVFEPDVNGFYVKAKSAESIMHKLVLCLEDRESIRIIAKHNTKEAFKKFRPAIYRQAIQLLFS